MINNVQIVDLKKFDDERGFFGELYKNKWFSLYDNSKIQVNHSFSVKGTIRGLHYHYWQYDYWYVPVGKLEVGLVDIRKNSPTFKQKMVFELTHNKGVFIPSGVAHGFLALEDTHLIYVVNNHYDSNDDLNLNYQQIWDVEPVHISERDKNAPFLYQIDESKLVF